MKKIEKQICKQISLRETKWSKMMETGQNGLKWSKMVKTVKMVKIVKNGQKLSKLVQNSQTRSKIVKNGKNCQYGKNGLKWRAWRTGLSARGREGRSQEARKGLQLDLNF